MSCKIELVQFCIALNFFHFWLRLTQTRTSSLWVSACTKIRLALSLAIAQDRLRLSNSKSSLLDLLLRSACTIFDFVHFRLHLSNIKQVCYCFRFARKLTSSKIGCTRHNNFKHALSLSSSKIGCALAMQN